MRTGTSLDLDSWQMALEAWSDAWTLPGLASRVSFRVSTRMRTSLGRCAAHRGEIRIASYLLDAPRALLEEVLCHELAHVAVAELHGLGVRAHGPEWKTLMRAVGRDPRVRIPSTELERAMPLAGGGRVLWEHRCPDCRAIRLAGRPVRSWRCVTCRRRGRRGLLIIARIGSNAAAEIQRST